MIPVSRRRLVVLYVIVAAMLVTLGGRLWYLQVLDGTQYKQLAMANQTRQSWSPRCAARSSTTLAARW